MGGPATIYYFELSTFYQIFYSLFSSIALFIIPHSEEAHLSIGKSSIFVLGQLLKDAVKDIFDT